jgi:pyrroline-5-carboxylate reductase
VCLSEEERVYRGLWRRLCSFHTQKNTKHKTNNQKGGAEAVAAASDIIVLGVKPQCMPDVLAALAPHVRPERHLIVSIAAGGCVCGCVCVCFARACVC